MSERAKKEKWKRLLLCMLASDGNARTFLCVVAQPKRKERKESKKERGKKHTMSSCFEKIQGGFAMGGALGLAVGSLFTPAASWRLVWDTGSVREGDGEGEGW